MQSRYQVQDEQDQGRHDEGVGTSRDGIGQLISQLNPVVVHPTARDDSSPIQMRNVVSGKESRADVTYKTPNGMYRKNVEGVVDPQ